MSVTVILGGQYGSEGKGKVAAYLAPTTSFAIRTGGPNAGHTIEYTGNVYKLQMIPCAFINPECLLAIGAGGIIDLDILFNEMEVCNITPGRLIIDPQAVIIRADYPKREEVLKKSIASTGKGVGVAVSEKVGRSGSVILARDVPELHPFLGDVASVAYDIIHDNGEVMLEGTQGFGLSLHHGHYPYVTSRDITAASLCGEAGIGPLDVDNVILVIRTYPIRVGGNSGPLKNEIDWSTVTRESGSPNPLIEYTTVTKKVRRVSRFDIDLVKRAAMMNSATQIALNFVDYIDHRNYRAQRFDDLTERAKMFIDMIERETKVPVTLVGTGPNNNDMIDLRSKLIRKDISK